MGGASTQEGDRVGGSRGTLMASWELFFFFLQIIKAKRDLVILVLFFGHFGVLRSASIVKDR